MCSCHLNLRSGLKMFFSPSNNGQRIEDIISLPWRWLRHLRPIYGAKNILMAPISNSYDKHSLVMVHVLIYVCCLRCLNLRSFNKISWPSFQPLTMLFLKIHFQYKKPIHGVCIPLRVLETTPTKDWSVGLGTHSKLLILRRFNNIWGTCFPSSTMVNSQWPICSVQNLLIASISNTNAKESLKSVCAMVCRCFSWKSIPRSYV